MANKYYEIAYKLYTIKDGERNMEEEAPASDPFVFITGFGTTIPGFEKHIEPLTKGDTFDFTLSKDEAYGDHYDERILNLDKQIFSPNGKFDSENVFVGAILPLQNEDGNRFMGQVLDITDDKVRIDLNHPLAGCELNFQGTVTECREATNEEIQMIINRMSGGGCHGGCGSCSGGCHGDGEGEGGCEGGGCEGGGCNGGGCGGCH